MSFCSTKQPQRLKSGLEANNDIDIDIETELLIDVKSNNKWR
jgi:hypothetical protein